MPPVGGSRLHVCDVLRHQGDIGAVLGDIGAVCAGGMSAAGGMVVSFRGLLEVWNIRGGF